MTDVRELILSARQTVARGVNAALVLLYWKIGQRIRTELLREKRADYGEEVVATVSQQLSEEFGRGFAEKNLRRMMQLAETFPEQQIVATLSRELGWSHFVELLPLKKHLQRDFYAEMCRIERWSVRTLRQKISGMLYERTALSKELDSSIWFFGFKRKEDGNYSPLSHETHEVWEKRGGLTTLGENYSTSKI